MAAPEDLALWGLHCFCLHARRTPQAVVRMDGNGRVLWLARNGAARAELPATGSQLALLEVFGLIARDRDRWRSTVPMVEAAALRAEAAALAAPLLPDLADTIAAIGAELAREGLADHAPAVAFGHLLDGWFWDVLRGQGLLPPDTLTPEHPFWRGAFWAVWPPVPAAAGLNLMWGAGASLAMVWTAETASALRALAADPATKAALEAAPAGDRAMLPSGPAPVIRPGGALDRLAEAAATRLAAPFTDMMPGLLPLLPEGVDPATARVIAGHELVWHLAARLLPAEIPAPHAVFLRA